MKTRKIPLRTCVVTQEQKPKKELIRIVRNKEGIVSVDIKGKAPGRGAYLFLSKDVIKKAQKSKALDRKLEADVPESIYEELSKLCE